MEMETCIAGIIFLGILYGNIRSYGSWYVGYLRPGTQCVANGDCGREILCQDGFCACSLNGTMIYDKVQKTCATLAGFDCSSKDYPCVSNAYCDKSTEKCTCNSSDHFSQTTFGECRLNYGLDCGQRGTYCNPEKFLRCNLEWHRCTCANDDEQIYNAVAGACLARPGERCEIFKYGISPPCAKNAICVPNSAEFGNCVCFEGFQSSDSSSCLPLNGSPCDLDEGCTPNRNLECQPSEDGRPSACACGNGTLLNRTSNECERPLDGDCSKDAIFDLNLNLCRTKAIHPCEQGKSDHNLCVRHAVCENGFCQCTRNHVATESGQCQLPYGSRCISATLVGGVTAECNQDAFLNCILGKCHCLQGETFDDNRGSCVQLLSTPCDLDHDRCISGSRCTPVTNGISLCKNTTNVHCESGTQASSSASSSFLQISGFKHSSPLSNFSFNLLAIREICRLLACWTFLDK